MRGPFLHLVFARLREVTRRPAAVFWVYVFPLITMVTLGIAFRNRAVEQFQVIIESGSHAEALADTLSRDPRFDVQILPAEEAARGMRSGKIDLTITGTDTSGGVLTFRLDPTRPGSMLARNSANELIQQASGRTDPVVVNDQEVEEPGGRYIDFLVPGLIGMGLMGSGLWGVGFAIVDLRIRKLLRLFLATPMKKSHFLAAMIVSRLVFTLPQILILVVFSRWFFGVANEGSWLLVGLFVILGAVQFAGIGLLVACRAQTLETVSGMMNLIMLPMWIGSGIFFSTDRFPAIVQPVVQVLPLTPLIGGLRAVMQEGAGLSELAGPLGFMIAWAAITFGLALRWFRWS